MSIAPHQGFHILPCDGSDVEGSSTEVSAKPAAARPYRDTISSLKHNIYVTKVRDIPHVAAIAKDTGDDGTKIFRVIIWSTEGTVVEEVPVHRVKTSIWRRIVFMPPTANMVLGAIRDELSLVTWHQIRDDHLQHELETLEGGGKSEEAAEFTCGLVYVGANQGHDEKLFLSNKDASSGWDEFIGLIGERVTLKGYQGFNGHLDTQHDLTGTESLVARILDSDTDTGSGASVMFHVSTMLPHDPTNDRQLDRKKFIGNDIVVILFMDGDEPYSPVAIKSLQNQVYFVVHPETDESGTPVYRLGIVCKNGVTNFSPPLPSPPVFPRNEVFRSYLYKKLLSARETASRAPVFQQMVAMARVSVLTGLANKHIPRG